MTYVSCGTFQFVTDAVSMPKWKGWKCPDTGRGIVNQFLLWRLLKIRAVEQQTGDF